MTDSMICLGCGHRVDLDMVTYEPVPHPNCPLGEK